MKNLQVIRQSEWIVIFLAFVVYLTHHYFLLARRFDEMVSVAELNLPASAIWKDLEGYSHFLNTVFPTITTGLIMFVAWWIFHFIACPQIFEKKLNQGVLMMIISIVLVIIGVFIYHYFKLYIRFKHDAAANITGLKIYSLYSKKTIFFEAIGVLILFSAYEILLQIFYFIHQKLTQEAKKFYKFLSYILFGGIMTFFLTFALTSSLPRGLWQADSRYVLMSLGLIIQVMILQEYFYKKTLPLFQGSSYSLIISNLIIYLFIGLLSGIVLWGVYSRIRLESLAINLLLTFIVSIFIALIRKAFTDEKIFLRKAYSVKSAEIANLRSQINPHFLFNALNSLYSTALKENSEKTADGIQKLGDMMRFMLNENNRERIILSKEIEYLQNYILIQRMRIDETHPIDIKTNFSLTDKEVYIAPMLLIPFVENAFKHGISMQEPSYIYITLTHDDAKVYFKVHNSLHKKQENNPEQDKSGIGLENVKKRLELIYPNRYNLDIQQSKQDFFISLTLSYYQI